VEALHRAHQHLATSLPVPISHGFSAELGLIALQSVPGLTLRAVLEDATQDLPREAEIIDLPRRLPAPLEERQSLSSIERLADTVRLLTAVAPELEDRILAIVDDVGTESLPATDPVHGDYYESQLLVESGAVVGMLDVDTYGWGRRSDDAATMIGHLAVWASMSAQPDRVHDFGSRLVKVWDGLVDPVDLRRRAAAVILSLAAGPFRVQSATWPEETLLRVGIAERWVESAHRIG
jgi:hypothetical protein